MSQQIRSAFIQDSVAFGVLLQRKLRVKTFNMPLTSGEEEETESSNKPQTSSVPTPTFLCKMMKNFFDNSPCFYFAGNKNEDCSELEMDFTPCEEAIRTYGTKENNDHTLTANIMIDLGEEREKLDTGSLFNNTNILLPGRDPASNPYLPYVIFHERTSSKNQNELIQFWIDTQHDDDNKTAKENTKIISRGLNFEGLWKASLRSENPVRHVVHIVITPTSKLNFYQKRLPKFDEKLNKLDLGIKKKNKKHNLKSYRIVVINPNEMDINTALENIISQPVALSMPLMKKQLEQSQTNPLPHPKNWWSYRATNSDARKLENFKTEEEFAEWRQALHDQDLVIGIANKLFQSKKAADKAFEPDARRFTSCNSYNTEEKQREEQLKHFCKMPFGCLLDDLGFLPKRWNGEKFFIHARGICCVPVLENNNNNNNNNDRKKNRVSLVKIYRIFERCGSSPFVDPAVFTIPVSQLEKNVSIGNLIHHNMPATSATTPTSLLPGFYFTEDQEIKNMWDEAFLMKSSTKLEKGVNNYTNTNTKIACGQLFTVSVYHWKKKLFPAELRLAIQQNIFPDKLIRQIDLAVNKFDTVLASKKSPLSSEEKEKSSK